MPADLGVNRTYIQAGRTPDTAQHLAEFRICQNPAAPIIQNNQVKFLRAVGLLGGAGPTDITDIGRYILCGRTAAKKP